MVEEVSVIAHAQDADEASEASPANANFWCGDGVLAPDAIISQESIWELCNGQATAWNGFDLTLRRIEQIYKRYQHTLALSPQARADLSVARAKSLRSRQGPVHRRACRSESADSEARNVPAQEAEQIFGEMLAENGVGVRQTALAAIFEGLNAGLKRAGKPLMGSWQDISLAHFALVLRRLKLAQVV